MFVAVEAVGTHHALGTAFVDATIHLDVVMVANVLEASVTHMVELAILKGVSAITTGGRTVQDDESNGSHIRPQALRVMALAIVVAAASKAWMTVFQLTLILSFIIIDLMSHRNHGNH